MVHEMKVDRPIILEGTIGGHQPHLPHYAAVAPPRTIAVAVEPSCRVAAPSLITDDGLAWLVLHPGRM
jgi:hypothetical protein